MKPLKYARIFLAVLLLATVSAAQTTKITWYGFDKDFITSVYHSGSAVAELSAKQFHPAKNVHSTSCGGNDGELHIGILLDDVDLPGGEMPLTDSPSGTDKDWGLVAELPNARDGDGPSLLDELAGKPVTFEGYLRVWDEGHGKGKVYDSNPHHVFEVHPAWGFRGAGVNFKQEDLVDSMAGYRGYGATKFKPVLKAMSDESWPLAYQDAQELHVGLAKAENFYQLPVKVRKVATFNGGHTVTVDVYSDKAMTKLVYSGLTCVTVTDSPVDGTLKAGRKTFLLGFFSVNLSKAMEESAGATSEGSAKPVAGAVEFFVFGVPEGTAVVTCTKKGSEQ